MKYYYATTANLLALSLLPILILQGKHTRRVTPRLPEAEGRRAGVVTVADQQAQTLRLLVLGESPVAGVGVATQHEAISSCFAQALAQRFACHVDWQALGKNGACVRDAFDSLLPQVSQGMQQDIILLAFGVNDSTSFRSLQAFEGDLRELVDRLLQRCQPSLLIFSGVPPVGKFTALPRPLRTVLGLKAAALDAAMRSVVARLQQAHATDMLYLPLAVELHQTGLLASDGYHPSAKACQLWGQSMADSLARDWSHPRLPTKTPSEI